MAMDEDGNIIDPYHGQEDLKRRSYVMSQMHLLKILYEFYVLQDSMLATIT